MVYILNRDNLTGPIGPLFTDIADRHLKLCIAEKIWNCIKELVVTSTDLICYEIDLDIILHLLDIVEEAAIRQVQLIPAKL